MQRGEEEENGTPQKIAKKRIGREMEKSEEKIKGTKNRKGSF
jgi:hypothetical protein